MIETNVNTESQVETNETPAKITTTMILNDLENGIGRDGIKEKYSLETWMVTELFKHPKLKGKKAKKKRALPFEFVDDTETADPNQTSIPVEMEAAVQEVNNEDNFESFDDDEDTNY